MNSFWCVSRGGRQQPRFLVVVVHSKKPSPHWSSTQQHRSNRGNKYSIQKSCHTPKTLQWLHRSKSVWIQRPTTSPGIKTLPFLFKNSNSRTQKRVSSESLHRSSTLSPTHGTKVRVKWWCRRPKASNGHECMPLDHHHFSTGAAYIGDKLGWNDSEDTFFWIYEKEREGFI